jgi:hypothetical protein
LIPGNYFNKTVGGAGNQRGIKWFIKPKTTWKLFHSPEKGVREKGARMLLSGIRNRR